MGEPVEADEAAGPVGAPGPVGRVVVWCDVGPERGVGHVMRCVALAEELRDRGLEVVFCAEVGSVELARSAVESRGLSWVSPEPDEADRLRQVAALAPVAVVVDSYDTSLAAYRALRERWPLLSLVDGDTAGVDGDLLLDQNIGAEADHWPVPPGARRLAGLDHALMREEVRAGRRDPASRGERPGPPRVLAFFGGTDAFGAGPVVVRLLLATGRPLRLRVVAPRTELAAELTGLATGPGQEVVVIGPTDRLVQEVGDADLVVSACGTSSWELLCLGAACAFVSVAANQDQAYERVAASGVAATLGRLADLRAAPAPEEPVATLRRLLDDAGERAALRRAGAALVDGRGRERVASALAATSRRRGTDPLV